MIVPDASALARAFAARGPGGAAARGALAERDRRAPHLVDLEYTSTIRKLLLRGELPADEAGAALARVARLRMRRYSHRRLLPRIWELRDNITPYDANYVALAEALGATLVTADARLARAPGIRCAVHLLE